MKKNLIMGIVLFLIFGALCGTFCYLAISGSSLMQYAVPVSIGLLSLWLIMMIVCGILHNVGGLIAMELLVAVPFLGHLGGPLGMLETFKGPLPLIWAVNRIPVLNGLLSTTIYSAGIAGLTLMFWLIGFLCRRK